MAIEEPTVKVAFRTNDSPFAGREGQFTTSRQLRERLFKELENDMALRISELPDNEWSVAGRGELHLAIFIERLRREGYELAVSRPEVIVREKNGQTLVPFERLFIETPDEYAGTVIQKLGARHGALQDYQTERGMAYLEFIIPTRGLFGYRQEFLTDTKGLGIMNSNFLEYAVDAQAWKESERGSLVAHESGQTVMYSLQSLQDRGALFYGPGVAVYKGEVVGEHSRPGDLSVNVCKEKHLTNFRAKGDSNPESFAKPRTMSLEDALEYIGDDELVEVTPKNIRIRKLILDDAAAKRQARGIKG